MEEFIKPLESHEIEWKIQSKTKTGKTILVPYIDARACYNRLDDCFGWENWNIEIRIEDKGAVAQLSIVTENRLVIREDGSEYTDFEAFKGGISGAIKRVCHQLGLGRELYDYPRVMFDGDIKFLDKDIKDQLENITNAYLNGTAKDFYILKKGENAGEPF